METSTVPISIPVAFGGVSKVQPLSSFFGFLRQLTPTWLPPEILASRPAEGSWRVFQGEELPRLTSNPRPPSVVEIAEALFISGPWVNSGWANRMFLTKDRTPDGSVICVGNFEVPNLSNPTNPSFNLVFGFCIPGREGELTEVRIAEEKFSWQ